MSVSFHASAAMPRGFAPAKALFARAARKALGKFAAPRREVNFVFVGDAGIRRLNRAFLGRGYVTDVIAFNHPPAPRGHRGPAPFGDVYICVPRAARQAREQGHSALLELLILCVHGALHLAGWDDSTKSLRAAMNEKTAEIIRGL